MRLYLASTSPARLAQLRAAGIEPIVLPSNVDEEVALMIAGSLSPQETVQLLAQLKAEAVAAYRVNGEPLDGFILAADSAFEVDGKLHGKPHTAEVARERWEKQRGAKGRLHTGHWLIDHRGGVLGSSAGEVVTTTVSFADDITDAELDAYIASGEPLEVAGAFTIDSLGGPFIREVKGDPHNVVGLSLAGVRRLLHGFGVDWHTLWNRGL